MKKLFLILLLPLSLFGATIDATLGTNCDSEAATIISAIQTAETNYAAAHGGLYFGLPQTSNAYPADGASVTPDSSAWTAAGITLPSTVIQLYQVDQYVGPKGNGYTIRRVVKSGGNIFEKVAANGPETCWNKSTWTQRDR